MYLCIATAWLYTRTAVLLTLLTTSLAAARNLPTPQTLSVSRVRKSNKVVSDWCFQKGFARLGPLVTRTLESEYDSSTLPYKIRYANIVPGIPYDGDQRRITRTASDKCPIAAAGINTTAASISSFILQGWV